MNPTNQRNTTPTIAAFHRDVDRAAQRLREHHGSDLHCRLGCHGCCRDNLSVFTVEAEHIRQNAPEVLKTDPAPPGGCAFLDQAGACRIYPNRPYVCRSQGLPLRWMDHEEAAEYRDICPLNEDDIALESLEPEWCWTLGPFEADLQSIQLDVHGNMERILLRDLFTQEVRRR